jgi:tetratricopeptide (TPR) repeat protein
MADTEAALPPLERALALARRASLRELEAFSQRELGFVCGYQGELAKARAYLEQSLEICRQIASPKTTGLVLRTLGLVLIHQGDYGLARSYSERALSVFREIGYRWGQGEALWTLALLFRRQGDYARARMLFEQVLETTRETRSAERESRVLADLGLVSHCLGDDETAREYGQRGLDVAERCGSLWYQAWASVVLGHALAGLAQFVGAIEAYRRAVALYREMHLSHWAANPLAGLARVALARGDRTEALIHAQELAEYLQAHPKVGSTEEPLLVYLTCHNVLRAVDDPRAAEVLQAAYLLLQERADTIEDEALRRSYLENVPYHREIVAAWEEKHLASLD